MKRCPTCNARYGDDHRFCPADGAALRSHTPPPQQLVGATLDGHYRLSQIAGRGTGGVVYKAWQDGMERDVAIKILHRQLLADPAMVERFHREARAVARLSHPNIVNVYSTGTTDYDAPFLAMEYIEGQRLDEVMERGPLPIDRSIRIIRQIVSALADSHAEGVVHRDLKPANVFLVQHRRTPDFVKIVDFGVAMLRGPSEDLNRLTNDGAVCGTPNYIAPEQAHGRRVDQRADLYSVGVLLYEMVTGRVPFEGSGMAVLLAHVHKPVPPPSTRAPSVGAELEHIILRCLEKDPNLRFQTADELADALDACANRDHAAASAPTQRSPAPTPSCSASLPVRRATAAASLEAIAPRRHRGRRILIAATLLALLALLGDTAGPHLLAEPMVAAATTPATPRSAAALPALPTPPARRALLVSSGRYSLRVLIPERVLAGLHADIALDLWDADGQPLIASEIVVTLQSEGEGGQGIVARPTERPGRYRFQRKLEHAGEHTLSVYAPGAEGPIQVFFDVVANTASDNRM